MPFGYSHSIIKAIARAAVSSFFSDVAIVGEENVPTEGPMLVCWCVELLELVTGCSPHAQQSLVHDRASPSLSVVLNGAHIDLQVDVSQRRAPCQEPAHQLAAGHAFDIYPARTAAPLVRSQSHSMKRSDAKRSNSWSKDSLFRNPVAGFILRDSGNIPVRPPGLIACADDDAARRSIESTAAAQGW